MPEPNRNGRWIVLGMLSLAAIAAGGTFVFNRVMKPRYVADLSRGAHERSIAFRALLNANRNHGRAREFSHDLRPDAYGEAYLPAAVGERSPWHILRGAQKASASLLADIFVFDGSGDLRAYHPRAAAVALATANRVDGNRVDGDRGAAHDAPVAVIQAPDSSISDPRKANVFAIGSTPAKPQWIALPFRLQTADGAVLVIAGTERTPLEISTVAAPAGVPLYRYDRNTFVAVSE